MTQRRLLRWSELATLRPPRPFRGNRLDRRLAKAVSIADLRAMARRRVPTAVFDYTDGAAGDEISLRRSRDTFSRIEFRPTVLRDVSKVDGSTMLLGAKSELPLIFGPTGFTRMMNHGGETAVARVAQELGIPYTLSTMGTTSLEALAQAVPGGRRWFQLYLWRDRAASRDLVARAQAAGYETLILTVDTAVAGARHRDTRNGLTIPPSLTCRTLAEGALHPGWWLNLLTTPPLEFASMRFSDGTVANLVDNVFDPAVTMDDLRWLRDAWSGPLLVKGVLTVDDARAVMDAGVDGVIISNHGGRQLDRASTPIEQLPAIVDAVGAQVEVYLDGGIMGGADVVAAVALGARACLVGRAYLYGLMAGGERGVRRAGVLLAAEIACTLQLLGVTSLADLNRDHVRLRSS